MYSVVGLGACAKNLAPELVLISHSVNITCCTRFPRVCSGSYSNVKIGAVVRSAVKYSVDDLDKCFSGL